MTTLLTGRGLTRDHHLRRTRLWGPTPTKRVLDGVDVDVHAGQTVAVIGESGSGKSTLVRILLGLQRATAGEVQFDSRPVEPGPTRAQHWLRRRTGIVLQDPYGSLDPRQRVGRIVAEPLRSLGIDGDHRRLVAHVLERVGLDVGTADVHPHALSGGQRQRVAIARAIVHGPELLVGDEPLSALDVTVRASVLELLSELRRERGMALLLVSHDLGLVRHVADHVVVLRDGLAVEQASADQLFAHPQHPYTRELIAAIPSFPAADVPAAETVPADPAQPPHIHEKP